MRDPKVKEAINLLAGKVKCRECDHLYYNYGSWICKERRASGVKKPVINFYRHCTAYKAVTEYNKSSNIKKMKSVQKNHENKILLLSRMIKEYE